jgi:hypothetical protein
MEDNNIEPQRVIKRFYTGWRHIKDTLIGYAKEGKIEMTAVSIAKAHNFNPKSVRVSAKRLGLTLAKDKRGGLRVPSNQHKATT